MEDKSNERKDLDQRTSNRLQIRSIEAQQFKRESDINHINLFGMDRNAFATASRREWTTDEEDLLITILQDIVVNGGRGDNGSFRSGTYEAVVSKMRAKIPGINITSKNVQNKIKRLKGKYSAAYDMLNTSGFGWNDANQCVIVETPEILEEYLKKHPNKNYMVNKPFMAYKRLKFVFGKDRAMEEVDESPTNALENMNMGNNDDFETEINVPLIPSPLDTTSDSSLPYEGERTSKRRKMTTELSKRLEETMDKLNEATDQMKKLVSVILDSTTEMDGLSNELKRLGLGVMEIIRMGKYFGDKPGQYRFWKSLDDDVKLEFVKSIYDEDK